MFVHFDNIIYKLQKGGGASVYWDELTNRVSKNPIFTVKYTAGNKLTRVLPVPSTADIFHSSHFRVPFPHKAQIVSTIHDLTYERDLTNRSAAGKALNIWQRKQAIDRADAIICISESTKQEMLDVYPSAAQQSIHVISHGTSFTIDNKISIHSAPRLTAIASHLKQFVLYVGVRTYYKNFTSALLGFAHSELPQQGYSLICTGKPFDQAEQELIDKLNLTSQVLLIDYATIDELQYLYQNALALTYTSTYEGFGLPPLEAMSSGCPVIAANTSSMPEVIGDSGILLDQITDDTAIAQALNSLLDNKIRAELVAKGLNRAKLFSWDKSAEQHIEVYKSLVI